jgi:UDP-glucuronate decarboxylase
MNLTLENKTVLITGGAGFLGSHLSDALLGKGASVVCFDDLSTGNKKNIEHLFSNPNFTFVEGDANNKTDIEKVFSQNKINFVFHYAARVGVLRAVENPLDVLRDIDGIKYILELSLHNGVEKVMFSSSSEVYGEPIDLPESEDGRLNAKFPYATVKLIGEHYMRAFYETHGLPTCSLRFFNVYGPRQEASSYGFVTGIFIRQSLEKKPLTVFGDGSQTRDFVYVDDNIAASIAALKSDKTNGTVLNIGSGNATTVLDLAEKISVLGDEKTQISFCALRKGGEILHRCPDVTKMKKLIEYEPHYSLEEGLKKTFDWYKEVLNDAKTG